MFMVVTSTVAQEPSIVSPQYKALKVVRPYDPFAIYFKVAPAFVGQVLYVDAKYAEDGWDVPALTLRRLNTTHFGLNATSTTVAPMTGFHHLVWNNTGVTKALEITVEVSCTDGDACNGMERLVRGAGGKMECVSTKRPLCDDRIACTQDTCDKGLCYHTIIQSPLFNSKNCPDCQGKRCKRNCKNKVCGSDGCGGVCGPDCTGSGEYCINGKCVVKAVNGTCQNPYDLTADAVGVKWNGTISQEGNTKNGINYLIPQCNVDSTAKEIIYRLTVPSNIGFTGIDARVHSTKKRADGSYDVSALDTVLQIIEVDPHVDANLAAGCQRSNTDRSLTVACADDSSPPGSYSSRVTWMLKPGYVYYIHVDGYSEADVGKFLLTVRLSPQCTLQCQGKYCGDSGCAGVSCGECADNTQCSADGLACIKNNCKKKCKRSSKRCGSDGCGGSCGTCDVSKNEFCLEGTCTKFPVCNPLLPRCTYQVVGNNRQMKTKKGCPKDKYCASDCKCRLPDAKLPDLAQDAKYVIPEIVNNFLVEPTSCALAEGCLKTAGSRRIIKFSTDVLNQGDLPFNPPNPPESRPDLYEWAPCHGHYHFQQFAKFELLNLKNETIVEGQKRSYCAVDSHKRYTAHPDMPCVAQTTCSLQGISVGWVDTYG